MQFEDVAAAKQTMRQRILGARKALADEQLEVHADAISERALALPEIDAAETVAAYYSIDTEPGTRPLVRALMESGRRVLLPIVLDDLDLDWAELTDLDDLETAGRLGLQEPAGSRLGTEGIATADVVICPGLAVDVDGARLGRGAGCYDRALGRAATDTVRCIVVYDQEVVESVPSTRRDERVHVAVTPTRTIRLGRKSSALAVLRTGRPA
ncbi:MAG: 5-formyltetrahydrofolate cyclo-ligase [Nocardioidaceae bacterium]